MDDRMDSASHNPTDKGDSPTKWSTIIDWIQQHFDEIIRYIPVVLFGVLVGIAVTDPGLLGRSLIKGQPSKLDEITALVEQNYYYQPSDPEEQKAWEEELEAQAISGMLTSLNDPYTRYESPVTTEMYNSIFAGKSPGVGITIRLSDTGERIVTEVFAGGPAEMAGIKINDILLDGAVTLFGDDNNAAVLCESGTTVTLSITRSGMATPMAVPVACVDIPAPPVSWVMLPDTSIAYIDVDLFGEQTPALLTQFLQEAEQQQVTGVILDLRGNGGGRMEAAQKVIGRFVSANEGPASYHISKDGEEAVPILNGSTPIYTGSLIVLVDGDSASASEEVAGALQDYNRAIIVGRPTFGKGVSQMVFTLDDGSSVRITTAEFLTPNRNPIHHVGIQPNVPVTLAGNEVADPDVAQAVSLLEAGQTRPSDLPNHSLATPVATPSTLSADS